MQSIKEIIGEDVYLTLDTCADKEVALAMQMELKDKWGKEKFYQKRTLFNDLLKEFELFENINLKFTPTDIVNILFEVKLLRAVKSEDEFYQRRGGSIYFVEPPFRFLFEERNEQVDKVIEKHFLQLEQSVIKRTLVTQIRDFNKDLNLENSPSLFFDSLFPKLKLPIEAYFDDVHLIAKFKQHKPTIPNYSIEEAERYFSSPSFGFTDTGSLSYVYFYASAKMRAFLNMLRIAGFIYNGQVDFGMWNVQIVAPSSPFFLGAGVAGWSYSWEEDKKKPWEKIPDGCLFRSFGYRGTTKLFLDERTYAGIEKFFIENNIILESIKNPWTSVAVYDIVPALDILSSATQTMDLGAKILQIYCCLEHLFVPKNITKDNVKYIIGGINALKPELIPWFNELYKVRCDYAHKGYIQKDDTTLFLVFNSITNTVALLTSKLKT